MASGWGGFSDADLRKMRGESEGTSGNPSGRTRPPPKAGMPRSKPKQAVHPMKPRAETKLGPANELHQSMRLSRPAEAKPTSVAVTSSTPSDATRTQVNSRVLTQPISSHQADERLHSSTADLASEASDQGSRNPVVANLNSPSSINHENSPERGGEEVKELEGSEGVTRDMANLDQFREQQKRMEELNRKKKQILTQTLAERQKKTSAETKKLLAIKRELSHLDHLLSTDVSLLRDRIELATKEYSEGRRRYEAAEKEFITSKINLNDKQEVKEQLTEHLYTIIHQNEVRKAQKLAELMDQLEMEAGEEGDTALDSTSLGLISPPTALFLSAQPMINTGPRPPTSPAAASIGGASGEAEPVVNQPSATPSANHETAPPSTNQTDAVSAADQLTEAPAADEAAGASTAAYQPAASTAAAAT